ncbi:MAG: adenosine deaminase [Chloroflexota bacterium]
MPAESIESAESAALSAFIDHMPKAEIHVHLEGSVRPRTVLELAAKNGVPAPAADEAGLRDFFTFTDFDHFIEGYIAVCSTLRQPGDFARIVREIGEDAAAQNILYMELHFNPATNVRKRGLDFHEMLAGMNAGRREALDRWGVEMRWIADGVRDEGEEHRSVARTVDWITALPPEAGVIGLGLGGSEAGFPPGLFVEEFARVLEAGLHVVAHAGETTGPETIWNSIRLLHAERIGHGIRAIDDPALVRMLAETGIPLEVCPVSNVRTRVVPSIAAHPFPLLDAAGVMVTVNSDDPPLFNTTLTNEFHVLAEEWGYDADGIERIAANAVRAAFIPEPAKGRMLARFAAGCAALRSELGLPPRSPA